MRLPGPLAKVPWPSYRAVGRYLGLLLMLEGGLVLLPLALIPLYPGETAHAAGFAWPGLGAAVSGAGLWLGLGGLRDRSAAHPLNLAEGSVVVLLAWLAAFAAGALPFALILDLDPTRALFESVSGFTTTGLSVLDAEAAPRLILFWRSLSQYAGGAGLAVIMLAAMAGPPGTGLSGAEGRGDQLVANVRASAKLVMTIYSVYAAAGTLAYAAAGLGFFDAVNHALCAVSTGGFSTRAASIGAFDSAAVEGVTLVLMILGSLNFVTAYLLWSGQVESFSRNAELRFGLIVFALFLGLVFFGPLDAVSPFWPRLRLAVFQTVTALTTTGYATADMAGWPPLGLQALILLMLMGGHTGSTAGGIKLYRVLVLLRAVGWQLGSLLAPPSQVREHSVYMGRRKRWITPDHVRTTALFVLLYLLALMAGVTVLAAHGHPLGDSLFEFASALGTVGLSVGITGAHAADAVLWTEMAGMFLGRLEFFVIFVALARLWQDFVSLG
jgi:trk system potassium uptake protein TrkH